MKGLIIKLINDGKVMDELELTESNFITEIKTMQKNYEKSESISIVPQNLWETFNIIIGNYYHILQSNEKLEVSIKSVLYDKKD